MTNNRSDANRPFSFATAVQVLSRRKAVLVLAFAGVIALAMPFVLGLPSLYRASATLLVEGALPENYVQTNSSVDLDNRLQAIKQEALSRAHLTELLDEFNLYPRLRGRVPVEILLAQLQRDIKIELKNSDAQRPTTIAFTISYTGRDPQTVAGVANRLASYYVSQNNSIRSRQASTTTDVLSKQIADTKKRMDAQEAKMQQFLSQHMGRLPQQVDANLLALNRVNSQIQFNAEQQSKLMERRQEIQKQLSDLDMSVATASVSGSTSDPVVKLSAAKRELADLEARFSDTYPDVRYKRAEVARLQREADATNGRTATTSAVQSQRATLQASLKEVEGRLDDLSKESRSLRSQTASYEGRVESAPARGPEYDALTRDYASTRDSYDQLLKKYDDARLRESLEAHQNVQDFRVLDAAVPPPFPAGPNRMRLLVLSVLLALATSVGATLIVDRLDTSFHSIDDLRSFTQVPVLASIPRIDTVQDRRSQQLRVAAIAAGAAVMIALLASGAFHYAHGSDGVARLLLQVG
jgi:polysaccharide chain length determinant protein (PEP-CTERM system associated)